MSAAQNGTGGRGDRGARAASFQEAAEDYDRLRPCYPAGLWPRLVEDVLALFERVNVGLQRPMTSDVEHREPDGSAWTTGAVVEGPEAGLLRESRREVAEWTWELPTATYLELLGTTSQYRVAEPRGRAELEAGLGSILGETVHLDAQTLLVEAVRA